MCFGVHEIDKAEYEIDKLRTRSEE
ncbi:uncharacterized protein G2W53_029133 [Senna tora]|uniref:Uncharacterized protein n=1 Tax=Senna tora TaxID=362788 RepID=A0A834WFG0_9FABA|nr:uncharacterized protein G2W53_029133 [Senna tora]